MIDWEPRVNEIFLKAIEAGSPAERAAVLDESCQGAPELRGKVEALLNAHDQLGSFLERPSAETVVPAPGTGEAPTLALEMSGLDGPTASLAAAADTGAATLSFAPGGATADPTATSNIEGPGSIIGPYKLLERIGEGGMGAVYMAEQEKPVRRKVALKLIKPGMDSAQVIARFEAERQALAMMDHPNIARVLEAGTTPTGRPYFVMELVKGVPLTQFCDERRLSPRQRLELMIPVCQAVQHAHQKGVIHRDLKPSNVLVALYDGEPVPKVIDFGIAKAIGPKLTEATLFTGFGAVVGTLAYMSPEQAELNQLDVDTRSDVYSLGVLLYELLTGSTPLDRRRLGHAALLEALRFIREEEPPRPSTRLSTTEELPSIAANRGMEPRKLSGLVRGDLDWIVMKALEKDRNRRYETPAALAQDVRRFLDDQEVEATPPSAGYRLRKFARRYRRGLTAAGAVAGILVAATAVSIWQAVRATRAEGRAVEAAAVAVLTGDFFIRDLLGGADLVNQADDGLAPDPDMKVRTLIDQAARKIEGNFTGRPLVEANLRRTISMVYQGLGLPAQARPHIERACELRGRYLGEQHTDTILAQLDLGDVELELHLGSQAEARCRHMLELSVRRYGEESYNAGLARSHLARILIYEGSLVEAETLLRRCLEMKGEPPGTPGWRFVLQINLATSLRMRGRLPEAESLLEDALRGMRGLPGDTPWTIVLMYNLAFCQSSRGRYAEADGNARKALEVSRRLNGDRHWITLQARGAVGQNLVMWGKFDQAEAILRPRLESAREAFGGESRQAIWAVIQLVQALRQPNQRAEAEALLRQAIEPARRFGGDLPGEIDDALGVLLTQLGRLPEAEQELLRAESKFARNRSGSPLPIINVKGNLAEVQYLMGRPAQAIEKLRDALSLCETRLSGEQRTTIVILSKLAYTCWVAGRLDEAEALYPRVIAMGLRVFGAGHETVFTNQGNFAALLHLRGRFEQAETQYREALGGLRRTSGPDHENTLRMLSNLGELYRDWGRFDQAETILKEALEAESRSLGADYIITLWTLWKIAEMDRDRGRFAEAEAKFLRCLDGYAKVQAPESLDLAALKADLGLTRLKAGAPDKAEPPLREALRVYDKGSPESWRRFEIQSQLGEALAGQEKYAEAEPLVIGGYEGMAARRKDVTVDAWRRLPDPGRRVVRLYEAWGKPAKAAEWRTRIGPDAG